MFVIYGGSGCFILKRTEQNSTYFIGSYAVFTPYSRSLSFQREYMDPLLNIWTIFIVKFDLKDTRYSCLKCYIKEVVLEWPLIGKLTTWDNSYFAMHFAFRCFQNICMLLSQTIKIGYQLPYFSFLYQNSLIFQLPKEQRHIFGV